MQQVRAEPEGTPGDGSGEPGIRLAMGICLAAVLLQILGLAVLEVVVGTQNRGEPWAPTLTVGVICAGGAMALGLLPARTAGWLRAQVHWSQFRHPGTWSSVFWSGLVVLGSQTLQAWYYLGRPTEPSTSYQMMHQAVGDGGLPWARMVLMGLLLVGVVPFVEEFLFRGLLFRALRLRFGFWAGALLSSALFTLLHGVQHLFPIAVLALVCCWLYEQRGSLAGPILLHAGNNLVVTALLVGVLWH